MNVPPLSLTDDLPAPLALDDDKPPRFVFTLKLFNDSPYVGVPPFLILNKVVDSFQIIDVMDYAAESGQEAYREIKVMPV